MIFLTKGQIMKICSAGSKTIWSNQYYGVVSTPFFFEDWKGSSNPFMGFVLPALQSLTNFVVQKVYELCHN